MMKDKKIIIGILVIAVLAITGIGLLVLNRPPTTPTPTPTPTQEITITTDKAEYKQGKTIKVTVRNNFKDIVTTRQNGFVEKKTKGGTWEKISLLSSGCVWGIVAVIEEIEAGESRTFEWKPVIYGCPGTTAIKPGVYRLLHDYQIGKPQREVWNWKTIRSNEFAIK